MEPLEKAYFETKFENKFLKSKGNEFQSFFNDLMERAYKDDYMPCRPWGKQGDKKNDGFLKSDRRLFQVYAPNEMTAREANKKIDEDFKGAKKYWKEYFDKWSFVHNARDGIPPHVQEKILELEKNNPGIKLDLWGWENLREVFRQLSKEDLESWFGYAPDAQTKTKIGFEEIRVVLESISSKSIENVSEVKQVPFKKIEANQLSDSIAIILKEGMIKSTLVNNFFKKWHDPAFGERIASSFREQYKIFREKYSPNEIFYEFQNWIGGSERGTPEIEMAMYAVIAYYF